MSGSAGDSTFQFSHTHDGTCVHYRGRTLYNPRSPRSSAEKRAEALRIEPDTLYLVASPLLGYGLNTLSKRLPDTSIAIAVELDPSLSTVTQKADAHGIRILNDEFSVAEVSRTISRLLQRNIRRVRLVALSGGYRFAPQQYDELVRLLTDEIALRWRNAATRIHFGRKWMRNFFRNASVMCGPGAVSDRTNPLPARRFRIDRPIVVCGAGESLEWNIETIREHRDRVYVFAVDTALGTLRELGVEPDAVLALESQVVNVSDFLPGLPPECLLYYDLTAHPSIPELVPPSRRRPFLTKFADLSILDRAIYSLPLVATIPPFSSVGITAVHIACLLTTHPVVVAGLDFAYILGKPHARGTLTHRLSLATDSRLQSPLLYNHTVYRPRSRQGSETGSANSPGQNAKGESGESQSSSTTSYETEAVLSQQVTLLSQAVKPGSSVYSLQRRGPPIHIPEIGRNSFEILLDQDNILHQDDIEDSEQLSHQLDEGIEKGFVNRSSVPDSLGDSTDAGTAARSTHYSETDSDVGSRFLAEECDRLKTLLERGTLAGMEYLFFDFPDGPTLERASAALAGQQGSSTRALDEELERKVRVRAESYLRYLSSLRKSVR